MKTRHFIILFLAVLITLPVSAQWSIGLSGGYAFNHYDYDPQYMSGLDYKGHHGFAIDFPVNYRFNNWLSLSSGLSFQKKGFVLNGSYIPEGSEESYVFYSDFSRDDSYFVVPIMAEFSLGNEECEGFVDLGGYAGWWYVSIYTFKMVKTIHPDYYDVSGKALKEFNNDVDQRLECGAIAGIGVKWNFLKRLTLYSVARTFVALTPQQKDYQIMHFPSRNITIIAQIGLLYHFN